MDWVSIEHRSTLDFWRVVGRQSHSNSSAVMSASKRLLLHVGQTKAGSTAIQKYLTAQRDALLAQGILFPSSVLLRRNPFDESRTPGHYSLLQALSDANFADVLSTFNTEIAQHDTHTVIISIESLFSDQPDSMLVRLAEQFHDWEIEIVAVLRTISDWIASRYIEECLGGFRGSLRTFEQFCEDKFSLGAHDYAGRLEKLATIFQSGRIRVTNYDAVLAHKGVVPAFLQKADLPSTNDDLALSIRANVREKELFLVEGKRRLNHVHAHLPPLVRQKLEHDIRDFAREIATQLPPDHLLFTSDDISFPTNIYREIARSNVRLVYEFGLVTPLTDPKPKSVRSHPAQHKRVIDGANEILKFGLHRMAPLLQSETSRTAAASAKLHPLALEGHEILIDQIIAARVILGLNPPDAAVIAACFHDKLPVYLSSPSMILRNLSRISGAKLPSDVVTLVSSDKLDKLMSKTPANLLICPIQPPLRQVRDAWTCDAPDAVLVVYGKDQKKLTDMALHLNLMIREQTEAFTLLVRRNTAQKQAKRA